MSNNKHGSGQKHDKKVLDPGLKSPEFDLKTSKLALLEDEHIKTSGYNKSI